jgi:hypothetical protein
MYGEPMNDGYGDVGGYGGGPSDMPPYGVQAQQLPPQAMMMHMPLDGQQYGAMPPGMVPMQMPYGQPVPIQSGPLGSGSLLVHPSAHLPRFLSLAEKETLHRLYVHHRNLRAVKPNVKSWNDTEAYKILQRKNAANPDPEDAPLPVPSAARRRLSRREEEKQAEIRRVNELLVSKIASSAMRNKSPLVQPPWAYSKHNTSLYGAAAGRQAGAARGGAAGDVTVGNEQVQPQHQHDDKMIQISPPEPTLPSAAAQPSTAPVSDRGEKKRRGGSPNKYRSLNFQKRKEEMARIARDNLVSSPTAAALADCRRAVQCILLTFVCCVSFAAGAREAHHREEASRRIFGLGGALVQTRSPAAKYQQICGNYRVWRSCRATRRHCVWTAQRAWKLCAAPAAQDKRTAYATANQQSPPRC